MSTVEKAKGVPFDNGPARADGQYSRYAVLPESERVKGFVRPVRHSYRHVGTAGPRYALLDLTSEQQESFKGFGFVKYEAYPAQEFPKTGRFWTQADLDRVDAGCQTVTTMGDALAETYARDPSYYGATFCCGCGKHLPVSEFVWAGHRFKPAADPDTGERVGS